MKYRIAAVLLAVLLLSGCNATQRAGDAIKERTGAMEQAIETALGAAQMISAEQAKNIALKHAGLTVNEVARLRTDYDSDEQPHYEVQFYLAGKEYEYEIDAHSGAILSWEQND